MKKATFLSKKILFLLFFVFLGFSSITFNIFGLKDLIYGNYPNLNLAKKILNKNSILEYFENDYNVKFLPKTQFLKLNLEKKRLNFPKLLNDKKLKKSKISYNWYESFYLELLENEILIVDYLAKIYHVKIDDIKNNDIKNLDLQSINSNLSVVRVLDTLIHKKNLYVYFICI